MTTATRERTFWKESPLRSFTAPRLLAGENRAASPRRHGEATKGPTALAGSSTLITLKSFRTTRRNSQFDLHQLVDELVGGEVKDGDVLVISSKFVAISEGRVVMLSTVSPSSRASQLSQQYNLPPELCELVLRESDEIIGGVEGFILAVKCGLLTPNAGIDKSNIEHGRVVLYPEDPLASAAGIAGAIRRRRDVGIGVVISDSRLMPTRIGTVGVALAAVGVQAVRDSRGKPDLFGNPLKVTRQAIADDLCTAAQVLMGEADEGAPIVLVRGLDPALLGDHSYSMRDFAIPMDQCVFMRSLGRGKADEATLNK